MLRIRRTNWVSALNLLALDPFSVRNSGVDKQIPRGRRSGRLDSLKKHHKQTLEPLEPRWITALMQKNVERI